MAENTWVQVFGWRASARRSWLVCWRTGAGGHDTSRVLPRACSCPGGALFNAANLLSGDDYAGFADQAHFDWVTAAWRAVVAPNVFLFISLLVVFRGGCRSPDP